MRSFRAKTILYLGYDIIALRTPAKAFVGPHPYIFVFVLSFRCESGSVVWRHSFIQKQPSLDNNKFSFQS